MKHLLFLASLLAPGVPLLSQYQPQPTAAVPAALAERIEQEGLEQHLRTLASDEFEGRETGTAGEQKAAAYIAGVFEALGLPAFLPDSSYFQGVAYTAESWNRISFTLDGEPLRHLRDYYAYPSTNTTAPPKRYKQLLFLGYGIEEEAYSDYKGVDVDGKAIVIFDGEPVGPEGVSRITGTDSLSGWSSDWRRKLRLAREKGVAAVFIIDRNFRENVNQARKAILDRRMHFGQGEQPEENYPDNYFINTGLAEQLFGKKYDKVIAARQQSIERGQSRPVRLKASLRLEQEKNRRQLLGENVLGYVEGTDPDLREEVVIITAHYDHLGRRGKDVYNGADDNASGTSAVLEIAEAFAEAKAQGLGPRRSVLLMLVSGEEKGLLGSKYYVQHPVFPLENTVANINIDMVGRVDDKHSGKPAYIYVIGSDRLSTELHQINETANATYTQLELDYTYNAEDDPNRYYYRSDHYNFAERGIPAIFYFNGTHADYHRTTDTVEKINFEKMEKIARLAFHTAWEVANRNQRIQVDVK